MRLRAAGLLAAAATTTALAACSAPESPQVAGGDSVAPSVLANVSALAGEGAALGDAVELVVQKCMSGQGLTYHPNLGAGGAGLNLGGIIGYMTPDRAESSGYAPFTVDEGKDQQDLLVERLSKGDAVKYQSALGHGAPVRVTLADGTVESVPSQGCVAQARAQVYGSLADYIRVSSFLNTLSNASDGWDKDPTLSVANDVYVRCMARAGVTVKDFDAARKQAEKWPKRKPDSPVPARERDLALKDAKCQQESGLRSVVDAAVLRKAAPWLRSHERDLAGLAEVLTESKARAAKIIAGGGAA